MPTPDTKIYLEQSTRTWVEWTPQLLRSALLMADGGSLRLAADLCDSMRGDGRVAGVLATRVLGLLGLPLAFETPEEPGSARVIHALEQDFPYAFPKSELAQLVSWGLLLGLGLAEVVWTRQDGRHVPRIRVWHPRWLRFDWPRRSWFLTVNAGAEIQIRPGDGKWVLFQPYGIGRPWAAGLWRQLADPWLSKRMACQDWNRYSEVHGNPFRLGVTPAGQDVETRRELAGELLRLGGKSAMAVPDGYDVKLVEATARTWETFPGTINTANTEISIAIVGQNLTTEVSEGSRAAATVHQSVKQDLIEFDACNLAECLHSQVLWWWSQFNFGGTAPRPQWQTSPPEDDRTASEVHLNEGNALLALSNAASALRAHGVEVDVGAMLRARGVPSGTSL